MVCIFVPGSVVGITKIIGYILLIILITILIVVIGLRHNIIDNWDKYRCNPLILPFSSFFGYDPSVTFTECLSKSVNENTEETVKPYSDLFEVLSNTAGNMSESIGDIRNVIDKMKDSLISSIEGVLKKISNLGATAKFMMMKIQAIF